MKKIKQKTMKIGDDYIKIQKKLNREIELERNGGRWVAVDRPHKNKKLYNRKRDKKIDNDNLASFFYASQNIFKSRLAIFMPFSKNLIISSFNPSFKSNKSMLSSIKLIVLIE